VLSARFSAAFSVERHRKGFLGPSPAVPPFSFKPGDLPSSIGEKVLPLLLFAVKLRRKANESPTRTLGHRAVFKRNHWSPPATSIHLPRSQVSSRR
jgi:hypothetical protein